MYATRHVINDIEVAIGVIFTEAGNFTFMLKCA